MLLIPLLGCSPNKGTDVDPSFPPCPDASSGAEDGAEDRARRAAAGPSEPLSCVVEAAYDTAAGAVDCGKFREDVKTGADDDADKVSLVPVETSIAVLAALTPPDHLDDDKQREEPTETTTWRLDNVAMTFAKLSDDGDYHLDVSDGTRSMITEIPFPGCIDGASPYTCLVTEARAAVEAQFSPHPEGECVQYRVSMVGVGFFDDVAGRTGQAPNGIELHPLLGVCFGEDCDPTVYP
jgi:hypothetical protein